MHELESWMRFVIIMFGVLCTTFVLCFLIAAMYPDKKSQKNEDIKEAHGDSENDPEGC